MPSNITSSPRRKRKEIKDVLPIIEVSLDETIKMPQLDLTNITLEKRIFLQKVLEKKKRQEEIRRELKLFLMLLTFKILKKMHQLSTIL